MSTQKNIADVLRKKGNTECLNKADSLQNDSNSQIVLQLRSLSLNTSDIAEIANIIKEEKQTKWTKRLTTLLSLNIRLETNSL